MVAIASPRVRHTGRSVPTHEFIATATAFAVLFVGLIDAVNLSITLPLLRHAVRRISAGELRVFASRLVAPHFVAAVLALRVAVTAEQLQDASLILASEFAFRARSGRAVPLVAAVVAIVVIVAAPPAGNAPIVGALEVSGIAHHIVALILGLIAFIIRTAVFVSITLPRLRDATTRLALQVPWFAHCLSAVGRFVTLIPAIIVVVAFPDVRDTPLVVTLEVVGGASSGRAFLLIRGVLALKDSVASVGQGDAARGVLALEL